MKSKLGQYFTTNKQLQECLYSFILNSIETSKILEPSCGRGDLVEFILSKKSFAQFDLYEIDKSIKKLPSILHIDITYTDFLQENNENKYNIIVGNPPFIRTRKGNTYIDFTRKCFNMLNHDGELIFIVPSDMFKLTSASSLLNDMMREGCFTHIYHPNNENLFSNASIDVMIFRYCKNNNLPKNTLFNNQEKRILNSNGIITFEELNSIEEDKCILLDHFHVHVGMVSGKDDIYKNEELGNIKLLNGKNKHNRFIYIKELPEKEDNKEIYEYMITHKSVLIDRRIKNFTEDNWFEWGAPRNVSIIEQYWGDRCIYIYNLTRKEEVCFQGEVEYFSGGLLMMRPKSMFNLKGIVDYLNSYEFKKNFMFSGRFKIGHKQLCNSRVPKSLFEV